MFFIKRLLRNLLRSLQWRLVFIFILMVMVLIIPISLLLNSQVESSYYNTFKDQLDAGFKIMEKNVSASPNAEEISNYLSPKKTNAVYDFNMTSVHKTYTIYDESSNKIIDSSDPQYNEASTKAKFELDINSSNNFLSVIANKTSNKVENKRNLTHLDGRAFFDYAYRKGNVVLYFRYYSEEWSKIIEDFNKIILNSLIVAIIAALIVGYILSKTITVPIINIMHKAQAVARGNFDQILEVKSDDEIGKLSKTINYMANDLKNTLVEISSEKSKIETILNYMTDGVIAFNLKGEVIHANPASKRILGRAEIKENFNDFSKKIDLDIALEEVLYLDFSGTKEKSVKVNDKYVRIYFALFTDEAQKAEGIIAVLQDITEQYKLESMRREFVANVSHELRTPLTSIKSYTETLLDGVLDDRETSEKFLGVINSEADRMTRLVKDLLQLSRLDNQQMQWNRKSISFVELVKNCIVKLQIEAKNKGQLLESYTIGEVPEIKADHDRIEQVVINILANAIKYTPAGGTITVYISKLYNAVFMKVVDTGIGIPAQDLPMIFERFYRVDKARSREMGGTGLGLSIAKEIVEAHGGSISVSSELDKGTELTIKLPIDFEAEV